MKRKQPHQFQFRWIHLPLGLLGAAFWLGVILLLTGCATGPVYYDQPPQTINGYDPTLTSHREALGLDQ